MSSTDEVKKLAALARIRVSDEELPTLAAEFESILAYVGQLEKLSVKTTPDTRPPLRNALREDEEPHESGIYTQKLVVQFPERDGDYLKVKQIIQND